MPYVGQFKAIAVLLVALCTFASFIYFRVWSSIDINNDNPIPHLTDAKGESSESVIFRQQYRHQHQQQHQSTQNKHKQESQQPQEGQPDLADSGSDGPRRPFLLPETELRPMMKDPSQGNNIPSDSTATTPVSQSQSPSQDRPRKNRKQREKERLKQEKAEQKRLKEERRRRKAAKLLRLQQLDKEPYPALISTNNARVAALNLKAFAKFCHSKVAQDRIASFASAASGPQDGSLTSSSVAGFASFEDWTDYIHNKNTGQEQEQATEPTTTAAATPAQNPNPSGSSMAPSEQHEQNAPAAAKVNPPKRQQRLQQRPLFMERPLRGWIINHTAIMEPCDRTIHTSAHCLDYLTKEHLYLIPSREARSWPNRIQRRPSQVATSEDDDIEVESDSTTAEGSIIDGYQQETGSGSDGRIVTTTSSITTTRTITSHGGVGAEDKLEEAGMMDFHIFWQGVITDKLSLSAHSFLFSQPLDRARLHLWIDSSNLPGGVAEDYLQNNFAKDLVSEPLNKYIKVHVWNQEAQHAFAYPPPPPSADSDDLDQPIEGTEVGSTDNKPNTPITPAVALSDEARFLILNRYGGMYLDADVILLRDMSPFYDAEMEFAYEWSNRLLYNTAILRLNKGSSVARRILDGATMKEKEIQEKKMRKGMKGQSVKVKTTKDRFTDVDPLRLKKVVQVKTGYKDKKRVRAGKSKIVKEVKPVVPSAPTSSFARATTADTPSAGNQAGYDSGEDDALGSSDGDSLFATPIDPDTNASSRRHHHHRRRLSKRGEMRPYEIYHPARLRAYLRPQDSAIENNGLVMMPVAVFDPLWLRVDDAESTTGLKTDRETTVEDLRTFPDAFNSGSNSVCPQQQQAQEGKEKKKGFTAGPEVFVMGAYAYHWHNNWLSPIEEQSWMGLMKEAYGQFLAGERPNLYGEWFHGDSNAFLF
ncbi:hypothetical protein EC957_003223 [Mortierella hygrophila]|uniref:Glycosyltransferase family 32 protein n=1 Tax=Mortierella hygrophila TaxID=979708 RepID=A0A9P6F2B3_9FUNG|nr:hypothetical protein EC957_003223 [Mortierella hygrophila]